MNKAISAENLAHFKELLEAGLIIPLKAEDLSKRLSVDKLPTGVPTVVLTELIESENPVSGRAIIAAIQKAIQGIGDVSKILTIRLGNELYTYNPGKALDLVLKEATSTTAGFKVEGDVITITVPECSETSAGLFTPEEKVKLESLEKYKLITVDQVDELFKDW